MRIISGLYKGKKLIDPIDKNTRPLKDIVKESIFNILIHSDIFSNRIENSTILDLFSGSGSFGLECISRGASKVIFFENYPKVLNILEKNIKKLNCERKTKIYKLNPYNEEDLINLSYTFDLIFIDPPYKDENISKILKNLKKSKIMKKNVLIIIHCHKRSQSTMINNVITLKKKIYGNSKIIFATLN